MKRFDVEPFETTLGKQTKPKNSEPLHEMEGSMKLAPFRNIVERVKDLLHDFPRAKAPLQQEHSSLEEDMSVNFTKRDQEKGSPIDEACSIDEEEKEDELKGSSSVVTEGVNIFLL